MTIKENATIYEKINFVRYAFNEARVIKHNGKLVGITDRDVFDFETSEIIFLFEDIQDVTFHLNAISVKVNKWYGFYLYKPLNIEDI